jgi:biopolymer transport protein ExbD
VRLKPSEHKRARIELIPMIDTIFFLLVFFMMASLAMTTQAGIPVDLPKISSGRHEAPTKATVTITRAGELYLDKQRIGMDELKPLLDGRIEENPRLTVIINADRGIRWGQGLQVMDIVTQANPWKMAIAGEPAEADRPKTAETGVPAG